MDEAAAQQQLQQAQLAALLGPDLAPFETLISSLMSSSNDQRSQAELAFNLCKQSDPDSLSLKLAHLPSHSALGLSFRCGTLELWSLMPLSIHPRTICLTLSLSTSPRSGDCSLLETLLSTRSFCDPICSCDQGPKSFSLSLASTKLP
uniref:Uncharacterized protein n=1 Tax=Rhizophora mucronata TaxID=61149 RepID=A0A2P2QF19_RHIMU